jgi:hypothetical protein
MKRIALLMIAIGVLNLSKTEAQTQQGKIMVGVSSALSLTGTGSNLMSFGYSTTKYKSNASGYTDPGSEKMTSFNLLPRIGYFALENLAIGLDVNFIYSKSEYGGYYSSNQTITSTIFGAGPFVRYYIPVGKVLPFLEGNGVLGGISSKLNDNSANKSSFWALSGGAGIAASLGDRVTFDVMVAYNSLVAKATQNNPDNERQVSGTIGLKLGFTVYLGK